MYNLTLTEEWPELAKAAEGQHLSSKDYDLVVDEEITVTGPAGIICVLLRGAISEELRQYSVPYLATVNGDLSNRAAVIGKGAQLPRIRADNTLSKVKGVPMRLLKELRVQGVRSDFLGWMDATPRIPYCHPTAWTVRAPWVYQAAIPLVERVNQLYARHLPIHYARQAVFMGRVPTKCWFGNSVMTTATINLNLRCTAHRDSGDFRGGMGNLVVLEGQPSVFILPRYKLGVVVRQSDALFVNAHEVHGNGPFKGTRLTAVLYARAKLDRCPKL
jgi:hypothetical protein